MKKKDTFWRRTATWIHHDVTLQLEIQRRSLSFEFSRKKKGILMILDTDRRTNFKKDSFHHSCDRHGTWSNKSNSNRVRHSLRHTSLTAVRKRVPLNQPSGRVGRYRAWIFVPGKTESILHVKVSSTSSTTRLCLRMWFVAVHVRHFSSTTTQIPTGSL